MSEDSLNKESSEEVKETEVKQKPKTKAQIEAINKKLQKEIDSFSDVKAQLDQILFENKELRKRAVSAESNERYVGIRSTCAGFVWLPAPEAGSGLAEDANKGRKLFPGKTVVVPSFWMSYYISNRSKTFLSGRAVVDNELGKTINPGVEFVEMELPDEFVAAAAMPAELEKVFSSKSSEAIIDFIDSKKDNIQVIKKIYAYAQELEEKYTGRNKSLIVSILDYLDTILFPKSGE